MSNPNLFKIDVYFAHVIKLRVQTENQKPPKNVFQIRNLPKKKPKQMNNKKFDNAGNF